MKTHIKSCIGIIASLFIATSALAASPPTSGYLMWQLPNANSGFSFPVYVYSNGVQVAYIPSSSLQYFASAYTVGQTSGTYQLYYQSGGVGSPFHGCTVVLSNGRYATGTTCPGMTVGQAPVQTGSNDGAYSNVWTFGPGAGPWPAAAVTPPTTPIATSYSNRTITFTNKTRYSMIQINGMWQGGSITKQISNVANNQTYPNQYTMTIGTDGLNSAAFYIDAYCTAATPAGCSGSTSAAPWVAVKYSSAIPSKFEPTFLPVATAQAMANGQTIDVPDGATNLDLSAVDGYTNGIGVKVYPSSPAYCTYTVPPEGSNVLGAGYYGSTAPLAQVLATPSTGLQALCATSSQLPKGYSGLEQPWNLSVLDPTNGQMLMCTSPCQYAYVHYGEGSQQYNKYCCNDDYGTYQTCYVPSGSVGPNTATYVTNIQTSPQFQNVYGFGYLDAGSDYGCPPETNFNVDFTSSPASVINFTSATSSNISTTGATITWAATDAASNPINYTYSLNGSTAKPAISPLNLTGLTSGTNNTVVISASDASGNKAIATVPFATKTPITFTSGPTVAYPTTASGATITWVATDSAGPLSYSYSLNGAAPVVATSPLVLTGLASSTAYSLLIIAKDAAGNVLSASAPFRTLQTSSPITFTSATATGITNTGAVLNWETSDTAPGSDKMLYSYATPSINNGLPIDVGTPTTVTLAGLTAGTTYNITLAAYDNLGNSAITTIPFTTTSAAAGSLSFTSAGSSNVTRTGATISWATSDTDPHKGTVSYTYSINNGPQIAATSPQTLTDLLPNTAYTVVVTASDQDHHTVTSSPIQFTTKSGVDPLSAPTNLATSNMTQSGVSISWAASTDTDPKKGTIVYTIHVSPVAGGVSFTQATSGLSATFTGLQANTPYNVTITAADKDNNTSTPATTSFTTGTPQSHSITAPVVQTTTDVTSGNNISEQISWSKSTDTYPGAGAISYTVKVVPAAGGVSMTQATTALTATFSGLSASTLYNVTVTATDTLGHTATSAVAQFTSGAAQSALSSVVLTNPTRIGLTMGSVQWAPITYNDKPIPNENINVTWAAVAKPDGNGNPSYDNNPICKANGCTALFKALQEGVAYKVVVTAQYHGAESVSQPVIIPGTLVVP